MSDFVAHADSTDIAKIEGLLKAGLYISNTMLVMETDIDSALSESEHDLLENVESYNTDDLSEYLRAHDKAFFVDDFEEMLNEELGYKNAAVYVLRERKRIVSSATVWDYSDDCIELENIFTVPGKRGKKNATGILLYLLSKAMERGMKRARLTVYGDNTAAIAFYYKLGFKVTKILQEFREDISED